MLCIITGQVIANTKYLTWPHHKTVEITHAVLDDWISQYDKDDFHQWAIVLKENGEPIGSISVVDKDDVIEVVQIG